MIDATDIQRLHLGHYTVPTKEELGGREIRFPSAGTSVVVTAFLIRHPRGMFLFDTGFGPSLSDADVWRPARRDVVEALSRKGVAPEDITAIANCHLHFDHGGGNCRFPGTKILAQKAEIELAHQEGHTVPGDVIDFPDATFEAIEGDADPLPGLRIIPTPGHTKGHQSLVVETRQGRVILAGQAQGFASEHALVAYARDLAKRGEPHADYPAWMDRFAELDPWRVLFAHDYAVWERPTP